jgi:DNA-binding winged helix-turn-helix (wHTH) protein
MYPERERPNGQPGGVLTLLRLNDRVVDLQRGSATDDAGHSTALRRQAAEVLKVLAAKPGEIVSKDDLMQAVWGNIAVSDDSLVQCVIEIRKALGDDKHQIVRTLPRRGYVLEAKAISDGRNATGVVSATARRGAWIGLAAGLGVLVMAATAYFWPVPVSEADRPAIAVLPLANIKGDSAGEQHELVARADAKVAALEEDLLTARSEIDALRGSVQTAGSAREEALRRELTARRELYTMRRAAYRAGVQMRAAADAKAARERAFEQQQQRADRLAANLALALREVERLKVDAVRASEAADTSLDQAKQTLDVERQKVGLLERDLAAARQSIDALEASATVAETVHATVIKRRQLAEAALMRVGEVLALERNKAESLTRALDTARQERAAAKDDVVRVSTAFRETFEQERDKALRLARELTAARDRIDILSASSSRFKYTSKARDTNKASRRATASVPVAARPARQSGSPEVSAVDFRKPSGPARLTAGALPAALLPTQQLRRGLQQ